MASACEATDNECISIKAINDRGPGWSNTLSYNWMSYGDQQHGLVLVTDGAMEYGDHNTDDVSGPTHPVCGIKIADCSHPPKCSLKNCIQKFLSGWMVDPTTGRCVVSGPPSPPLPSDQTKPSGTEHKGRCWEAHEPDYPTCSGYKSAGYTCVRNYCAAMDPAGEPKDCAEKQPKGTTVDPNTGRCV